VVEARHHTLLHPHQQQHPRQPIAPAPPYGGGWSSGSQPAAPPPRRRTSGGRRVALGTGALVVAAVATFLALPGRETETVAVSDAQGIEYRVPREWERTAEAPITRYEAGGTEVVTVRNHPSDGAIAPVLLADYGDGGPLCQGTVGPGDVDGATSSAACTNDDGDVAVVVGASRNTQFWVVTVHRDVPADEREAFLESLHLIDPASS
jgi:hypothetical protein